MRRGKLGVDEQELNAFGELHAVVELAQRLKAARERAERPHVTPEEKASRVLPAPRPAVEVNQVAAMPAAPVKREPAYSGSAGGVGRALTGDDE
jgi:hypothetical protein